MTEDSTTTSDDSGRAVSTDGGGLIPPDDETPTWLERQERSVGLSRLTYEYFERSRREDDELRRQSTYLERDVLGFPTWPHETIRNLAITSFFVGLILLISATMPPHIGEPANPSRTPAVILPDWYLYWTFGTLKLQALNPELAILGGEKLISDRAYGVLAQGAIVGVLAILPFINTGKARRPVEEPFWAALGVGGLMLGFTLSVLSVKNLVPMDEHLLFDLTFLLPVVTGLLTYSLLRTMREGYMFDLNRRYYRLRPPK